MAALAAASGSQPGSQASDLWGTPALGSAPQADPRTPLKLHRLAIASQPEEPDPFNQEDEVWAALSVRCLLAAFMVSLQPSKNHMQSS